MSKQDRAVARTPSDLQRRYRFGKSFAETKEVATKAQESAKEAVAVSERTGKSLEEQINDINARLGDIDTLLDDINGEVV